MNKWKTTNVEAKGLECEFGAPNIIQDTDNESYHVYSAFELEFVKAEGTFPLYIRSPGPRKKLHRIFSNVE